MATLTTSWKSYATASFDSGPATIKFYLEAKYSTQSVGNNTTSVQTRLRSAYTEGSSMAGAGYKFTCSYASTVSGSGVWYFGNEVITSGSGTITHNADGSKSITLSASAYNKYWNFTKNMSATVSLPKINRYATITSSQDFNDESDPTLGYSNPAGNSVSSLQACIASTDAQTIYVPYRDIPKTGSSYKFNLTTAERNALRSAIPNSKTLGVRFYVKTVNSGNTFYQNSGNKTMSIVNANPIIQTSNITLQEQNAKVIQYLGTNVANTLIANVSKVGITVVPQAVKYATISNVKCIYNNTTQQDDSSPYNFTVDIANSATINFTTTDSRSNVGENSITKNIIVYEKVRKNSYSAKRVNPTSSNIRMRLDVVYYQQTFGTTQNVETVQYKLGEGNWITLTKDVDYTVDNENHKITMDYTILNASPYDSDINVSIKVSDLLSEWSETVYVSKGIPVFEFGDDECEINGELYIADTARNNKRGMKGLLIPKNASDLNEAYETGMVAYSPSTSNAPTNYGVVYTFGREKEANKFWVYQIAFDAGGGIYRRQNINDLNLNSWTAWQPDLATDTGWKNLQLKSGVTNGTLGGTPRYRKIGNVVYIQGGFQFTKGTGSIDLATVPEGFRPDQVIYVSSNCAGTRTARTYVTSDGRLGCDWIYNLNGTTAYTGAMNWYQVSVCYVVAD